jgi:hypothetical protein
VRLILTSRTTCIKWAKLSSNFADCVQPAELGEAVGCPRYLRENPVMKSSVEINALEIAMIELEYAVADLRHVLTTSQAEPLKRGDFDALVSQLIAAKGAVQIAASALTYRELQRVA